MSEIATLERGIAEREAALAASRSAFQRATNDIAAAERDLATYRAALTSAKADAARAERIAAASERVEQYDTDVDAMRARFLSIAADKPWYIGTGNDDSIMAHQWQGAQFGAAARRFILGDGVGLGKTRTTTAWLDLVGAKRVIIVCEPNIVNQFAGEVMTLAPHRAIVNLYKRTPAQRDELLSTLPAEGVVFVNFQVWYRDQSVLERLIAWQADTVIVDEAHNLKSTRTKNFQYLKALIAVDNMCPECGGRMLGLYDITRPKSRVPVPCAACGWMIGKRTSMRPSTKFDKLMLTKSVKNLCLTTGTPILNEPGDLFSLLHLINPLVFPTRVGFESDYLTKNYAAGEKWEFRPGALSQLKPVLRDVMIARTREDAGIVLPVQRVHVVPVMISDATHPKQRGIIRSISEEAVVRLESGLEASIMHVMALMTRKRQANVHPGGITIKDYEGNVVLEVGSEVNESAKLDEVVENIVRLHEDGREVQLAFSQFKTALIELERRLSERGLRVARFDGDTPKKQREAIKSNLLRAGGEELTWDVVLLHYRTGGTGLNFTRATATHILDEEWGPGKRDQAYGRTNRLGQTEENDVYVYRIPASIDTWMSNTIRRKERLINDFESGEHTQSELAQDLLESIRSGEVM